MAKILSNSLWGKFGENLKKPKSLYFNIYDKKSIEKLNNVFERITSTCLIDNEIAVINPKKEEQESYKTSMAIAAFTTCWGRLQLYSALEEVDRQGGKVYYSAVPIIRKKGIRKQFSRIFFHANFALFTFKFGVC